MVTIANQKKINTALADRFVAEALFITITNANFDAKKITERIFAGVVIRENLKKELLKNGIDIPADLHDSARWTPKNEFDIASKSLLVSILNTQNEDIRSLRELLIYGVKGMAAYAKHAQNLGYLNNEVYAFMHKALVATTNDTLSAEELTGLVLECGKNGVDVMALLDI